MSTVSLCMIVRNNGPILEKCLSSVAPFVDEIVVVDPESTDNTKEVVRKYTDKIYDFSINTNPEAFLIDSEEYFKKYGLTSTYTDRVFLSDYAAIRNFSFSKATSDYILWMDSDDILVGGGSIKDLLSLDKDRISCNYEYSFNAAGGVLSLLKRERIVKKSPNIKWVFPAHEILEGGKNEFFSDKLIVKHLLHSGGNSARIISNKAYKILIDCYFKNNKKVHPRTLFYLASEVPASDERTAVCFYEEYLKVATWDEEKNLARCHLGFIKERKGDYNRAYELYSVVSSDCPQNPDGFWGMARVAYYNKEWDKCIRFTEQAIKNSSYKGVLWSAFNHINYDMYYTVALWNVGRKEDALASCERGLIMEPGNSYLKTNFETFKNALHPQEEKPMMDIIHVMGSIPGKEGISPIAILANDTHFCRWLEDKRRLDLDEDLLPKVLELIAPGDIVIDAGAFIGDHTLAYSAKAGTVFAFEPQSAVFECLKQNADGVNNIVLNKVALSDSTGEARICRYPNPGASRIGESGEKIEIFTLDSFNIAPNLIKMDVEGYEVKALMGAQETINKYHPILVLEVNKAALEAAGFTIVDLYSVLVAYGYDDMRDIRSGECFNPTDGKEEYDIVCHPKNLFEKSI
jgi:FkbM family methyltransferase